MRTLNPVIDTNGDINLHGRQGAVMSVAFVDDDGLPRDMTGKTIMFECGTGINIALTDGTSSDQRVLTISQANVKIIFQASNRNFVVMDQSGGVPTPLWVGTVYVTGWVE